MTPAEKDQLAARLARYESLTRVAEAAHRAAAELEGRPAGTSPDDRAVGCDLRFRFGDRPEPRAESWVQIAELTHGPDAAPYVAELREAVAATLRRVAASAAAAAAQV